MPSQACAGQKPGKRSQEPAYQALCASPMLPAVMLWLNCYFNIFENHLTYSEIYNIMLHGYVKIRNENFSIWIVRNTMKSKYIPNIITAVRILGTLFLLWAKLPSLYFFVIYSICGFSDVLDGWLARKTKTTSEFGARLDSVADLLFYGVMLIKLMPVLVKVMPSAFWIAVSCVVIGRLASYIVAAMKYKRFAALHTYLNKLTGLGVFIMPYITQFTGFVYYVMAVCGVAALATFEELFLHIRRKEYRTNA